MSNIEVRDWAQIYSQRREAARALMAARGLDALLVATAPNRFYLSGFELHDGQPGESAGMILICRDGRDWLATDSRYVEAARRIWPAERIFIYKKMAADLARLLRDASGLTGVESEGISWKFFMELQGYCSPFARLVPADGLIEELRVIKEPAEVEALEASFRINQQMYDWLDNCVANELLTDKTEASLAWEIEKFFRAHGAQGLAFGTIVASGANGALPHAIPGSMRIVENTPLLIDAGCRARNYCSDQTRSWWYGPNPAPEFERALALVQEAQAAALDCMKPGVPCADVYAAAKKVFEKAGVADAFTHGLGHGVGLETHEAPALSPTSRAILKAGMVVTVEPGLYYPAWGGVRWEHTVLVEDNGVRILGQGQ